MLITCNLMRSLVARSPRKSEEGVTALEYGLIAALIAVVIISAVSLLGNNIANVFTEVAGNLH